MRPGWRRFLDVLRIAIGIGAKVAKRPRLAQGLQVSSEMLEQLDDGDVATIPDAPTPPQTPKAKHRGLK